MDLKSFIFEAKSEALARDGRGEESTRSDGGLGFYFELGEFSYRDTYYGFSPFAGQELVWIRNKPLWVTNYFAEFVSVKVTRHDIFRFQHQALVAQNRELPFRGPTDFALGSFHYNSITSGDMEYFSGSERIGFEGEPVFILHFHGGML